jgi:RNA recognition motif-containing protein
MRPVNFQGNIHILNFPADTAAADLAALFDDFGLVLGAQIKMIATPGGSQRLGIVAVAPDAAADRAVEALQGHAMGDRKLKLVRTQPQVRAPKPKAPGAAPRPQAAYTDRQAAASPSDRFPAHAAPPRKVIVEYRGRRPLGRV